MNDEMVTIAAVAETWQAAVQALDRYWGDGSESTVTLDYSDPETMRHLRQLMAALADLSRVNADMVRDVSLSLRESDDHGSGAAARADAIGGQLAILYPLIRTVGDGFSAVANDVIADVMDDARAREAGQRS